MLGSGSAEWNVFKQTEVLLPLLKIVCQLSNFGVENEKYWHDNSEKM